jgi:SM-20-related protein
MGVVNGNDAESTAENISEALATTGCIVLDHALPAETVWQLNRRARELEATRAYSPAGIGRGGTHHRDETVRSDEILWLSGEHPAEAAYLSWMEDLRVGLNQRLFLGLFDYECHFAVYAPGAYYRRHLDAFQGQRNRIVTTVFYLNGDWNVQDGGELLIYGKDKQTDDTDSPLQVVSPTFGRLVVFLSDQYPHEVLPANRHRYSIAGWFRLNVSGSHRIDPAR